MRCLLTFLLAITTVCPAMGQIIGSEYFIDIDPGYGAATFVPVTPATDVSQSFTLGLTTATPGFHIAGLRAKDAQGHWSQTYLHSFYVIAKASNISNSEYFIDTDPGYGKATAIPVALGSDSSLNYLVPLSSYNTGFHTIGIRSKDNQGIWSQTNLRTFYIDDNSALVNITSLEYYFSNVDQTTGFYTYQVPVPSPNVDLNFTADLSQLAGNKDYNMYVRAINAKGVKGQVLVKKIRVCNGDPAKAKFDVVVAGNQVSFINNSIGGSKYVWDFGDNKTDSILNPLHTYAAVGLYNAKLIVSNLCISDTIIKVVSIAGLKDITTNHGGNAGTVTVTITGAGFVPGTKLFLHKSGQPDIYGDTLIINNISQMTTTFDLSNKALGLRDVIAVFPNGKQDTLHNGFTIEAATAAKLWVNIDGPGVLRIGFNQVYTITYGNSGNTDALFVPLIVSGLPLGTDIEILNPLFKLDSLPGFDTLKLSSYKIRYTINDSSSNTSSRGFFVNIASGSTNSLNFIFHLPATAVLHTTPKIKIFLGNPVTPAENNNVLHETEGSPQFEFGVDCIKDAAIAGFEYGIAKIVEKDPTGVFPCAAGIGFLTYDIYKLFTSKSRQGVLDIADMLTTGIATALPCTRVVLNLAAVSDPLLLPEVVEADEELMLAEEESQNAIDKKYQEAFNHFQDRIDIAATLNTCYPFFKSLYAQYIYPIIGNAFDPNQKYGTGDASDNHYTTSNPLSYTINFENNPSSNLNAQTVTVTDTLNSKYYDKSSFGFTSAIIGDSVYSLSSPAKSFIHDFDFTAQYGVKARVTASFDTATGVAQWKMLSIDPTTNQATTNALAGFLPPDVVSPKGQGYVSFTVQQNPAIQTGDSIHNVASIKFDYNPVITTNSWKNVFDFISPISSVQNLPAVTPDTTFTVKWSGTDNASGIRSYDVYYAMNDGTYQLWLSDVSTDSSSFTGKYDSTYKFYSIAKDNAGNIEVMKTIPDAVTRIAGSGLPVTATPLIGILNRNFTVTLYWNTLTEINNKGFDIERNDGTGWVKIGFVNGHGSSSFNIKYVFADANITVGKSYMYRYKQIDYDGRFAYSNVVAINVPNQNNILSIGIAPNPFANKTTINYNVPTNENITMKLVDYTGRDVATLIDKYQQAGTYKIDLNAALLKLSSGTYYLYISDTKESIVKKIILIN